MKIFKIAFLLTIPVFLMTGCKKSFFTDININPNALSTVPPNLLLPTTEAALAYTQGGDISRYTSLITQQVFGANSQSAQYYIYNFNPGVFDNLWPDLYTSTLENDYTLIQIATAGGYNEYAGIGKIIMAYSLQVSVDLWGDIPYSTAFKGNSTSGAVLHPTYDKAQALYDTIANLIDAGTVLLGEDPGGIVPGADDVLYGGDASKWIKFGHAIKARLAIHQSKGDAAMAATALTEAAQSFTKNSEGAAYIFGTTETSASSWYQFYRDRPGDINYVDGTLAGELLADNDPRYGIYDLDSLNADGSNFSYYNQINSPTEFITYDEILFIEAEATLRSTGDFAGAQTFYQNAIIADLTKLGVAAGDIAAYVAANGTLPTTSVDDAIAKVAAEEFKALYLNPEAWVLWRRTGVPALTTTSPGAAIPRRLLYPQSELNYNGANTPAVTLYTPLLFWDK